MRVVRYIQLHELHIVLCEIPVLPVLCEMPVLNCLSWVMGVALIL